VLFFINDLVTFLFYSFRYVCSVALAGCTRMQQDIIYRYDNTSDGGFCTLLLDVDDVAYTTIYRKVSK